MDRTICLRALENLDDCSHQVITALAETDDPATAAELSDRLNDLDTGRILVHEALCRLGSSGAI